MNQQTQLAEGCQQRSEIQHASPREILWKRGCTPLAMHPLEWHEHVLQLARSRSSSWKKNILPAEKMLKAFKVVATSYTLLYTNKLIMFHHDIYEVYIYIHELPNFFSQWPSLIPVIFWNIQQKQQVKWYKQGYQWFGPCRWWHWSRLPS